MSQVDDILSGLDLDNVDGGSRFPFATPGKYEAVLRKAFLIPNGFKGTSFVANFETLKSEKATADDMPHAVGTVFSVIYKLGGQSRAALMGPNQLVGILGALTGFSSELFKSGKCALPGCQHDGAQAVTTALPGCERVAAKRRIAQLLGSSDGTTPEGPMVRLGCRVNALCYRDKTQAGNLITPVSFSMMPGYTYKELAEAAHRQAQTPTEAATSQVVAVAQ